MMDHLGGPESPTKIAERQARYERTETGVFKIVQGASAEGVGWVGYWDRTWQGAEVYEMGWSVIPVFQGRGIALRASELALAEARAEGRHRFVHAFPSPHNGPSNAICRKLGFTLLGGCEVEFPPGHLAPANDWRGELSRLAPPSA